MSEKKRVFWVDDVGGASVASSSLRPDKALQLPERDLQQEEDKCVPIVTPPSILSATQEDWEEGHDEGQQLRLVEQDENAAPRAAFSSGECSSKNTSVLVTTVKVDRDEDEDTSDSSRCRTLRKRKQRSHKDVLLERTRFKDIIGHGAVKLRIEEMILPMALPTTVAQSVLTGIRALPASILLYGPPGCGKVRGNSFSSV